jgi:hypothetical protein
LLDDTHNVDLTAQDLELIEAALHTHEKILSVQSRAGAVKRAQGPDAPLTAANAPLARRAGPKLGASGARVVFRWRFAQVLTLRAPPNTSCLNASVARGAA